MSSTNLLPLDSSTGSFFLLLALELDRDGRGSVFRLFCFLPRRVVLSSLLELLRSSAMLICPCFIDDFIFTCFGGSLSWSGGFLGGSRLPRRGVVLSSFFLINGNFDLSCPREQPQYSVDCE